MVLSVGGHWLISLNSDICLRFYLASGWCITR